MRDALNAQADRIEAVLLSHNLPCHVAGGVASPHLLRFDLALGGGVRVVQVEALANDIALHLGVHSVRIGRAGSYVTVEVVRTSRSSLTLLSLMQRIGQVPPFTAPLGLSSDGTAVGVRLTSPDVVHALIAGTTGSGKTELARTILLGLAMSNPPTALRLVLIDPKGSSYRSFDHLPHLLAPAVSTATEAMDVMEWLVAEMERRDRLGLARPCLLLVIDELADLLVSGGKPLTALLARLAQRGRSAGIHIVACIQRPSSESLSTLIKSSFPSRLVGKMTSIDDARLATGVAASGAERLLGRGDFLLVVRGQVHRFQAARASYSDIIASVDAIRHQVGPLRSWETIDQDRAVVGF